MDTTDILRGAFRRAREREEAEQSADEPETGSPGRDERGFTTTVSKAEEQNEDHKADREPTKQERIVAIEAELDRLARERGTVRSNPDRSRIAQNIGRHYLGH